MTSKPLIALDPTSGPLQRKGDRELAARPSTLDSQVIGLVANGLGRSEEFMLALGDEIERLAKPSGAVHILKLGVSVPPEPTDWARLTSEVSVAITGFGG